MNVQDAGRVSDLAVRYPHRNDHAPLLKRLAVHVGFVLRQRAAEHALPQAGLAQTDPVSVKRTDVVGVETAGLEPLYRGLSLCGVVERGNNGLVTHAVPPVWTAAALCRHQGFHGR